MVLVAMAFTNNLLNARLAENEFTTNKQFMLTTGLQIDDIAWTIGRTQTLRYSTRFAQLKCEAVAVEYSFEIKTVENSSWTPLDFTCTTSIIMFNMPISNYHVSNEYVERIFPSANFSFVQNGTSAPVSHVYVIEKLPMTAGNYTRVVVVPTLRMLDAGEIGGVNYVKFFLPLLENGESPMLSQSVTLIGTAVTQYAYRNVTHVKFIATFPQASQGFDSDFFKFQEEDLQQGSYVRIVNMPAGNSVVEFYVGEVTVSLGLHV